MRKERDKKNERKKVARENEHKTRKKPRLK